MTEIVRSEDTRRCGEGASRTIRSIQMDSRSRSNYLRIRLNIVLRIVFVSQQTTLIHSRKKLYYSLVYLHLYLCWKPFVRVFSIRNEKYF